MIILYGAWLQLPIMTRIKIASEFGFKKTGATHVVGNEVQNDGYAVKDIEKALTIENMQKYTELTTTDVSILWNKMIDKAEGRVVKLADLKPEVGYVPHAEALPKVKTKKNETKKSKQK